MKNLINTKTLDLIIREEGHRRFPYLCTAGKTTIGYGFNLDDVGISKEESAMILEHRIAIIKEKMFYKFLWFRFLSENRKAVILSMIYQLGYNGFMGFRKAIKAIEDSDYELVVKELKDSRAYLQTRNRWDRQIEMFIKG